MSSIPLGRLIFFLQTCNPTWSSTSHLSFHDLNQSRPSAQFLQLTQCAIGSQVELQVDQKSTTGVHRPFGNIRHSTSYNLYDLGLPSYPYFIHIQPYPSSQNTATAFIITPSYFQILLFRLPSFKYLTSLSLRPSQKTVSAYLDPYHQHHHSGQFPNFHLTQTPSLWSMSYLAFYMNSD